MTSFAVFLRRPAPRDSTRHAEPLTADLVFRRRIPSPHTTAQVVAALRRACDPARATIRVHAPFAPLGVGDLLTFFDAVVGQVVGLGAVVVRVHALDVLLAATPQDAEVVIDLLDHAAEAHGVTVVYRNGEPSAGGRADGPDSA